MTLRHVLVVLGIVPSRKNRTRTEMRAWRAYQIAYLLTTLDEAPVRSAA